ncbi:MAG: ECF-type sigma factor [Gemmatimonadota bacterium]
MSQPTPEAVTQLLRRAHAGDDGAFDQLFDVVYDELKRLAQAVRRSGGSETINTTALVHEAYVKLTPSKQLSWADRSHFFGVAARAMRQVLIAAAEKKSAKKRGGGQAPVEFDEQLHGGLVQPDQLLDLDRALATLEAANPRQARVVECRFFAGLSVEETAEALGVSEPTVKRDWRFARAWLTDALQAR